MLHAVGQAVAENRDDLALLEREGRRVAIVGGHVGERGAGGRGFLAFAFLRVALGGGDLRDALAHRLGGLPVIGEVSQLAAGLHIHLHRLRRGDAGRAKDFLPVRVEQREREAVEPALVAAAVPHADLLDVLGRAEVELPPRVPRAAAVLRVGLASAAELGILVAVNRPLRHAAVVGARLRRLAFARNVLPAGENLDLREREHSLVAGKLNADETRGLACGHGAGGGGSGSGLGFGLGLVLLRVRLLVLLLRRLRVGILNVVVRRNLARETRIHLRLDAARVAAAVKGVRLERPDERDVQVRLDAGFEAQRPEATVHQHPAVTFVRDVLRRAVERREDARRLARRGLVTASPLGGLRGLGGVGG